MTIRFVENPSDDWIPIPNTTPFDLSGTPPRRPGGFQPQVHELRPGERIYWVEGDLPEPPPENDPRWDVVRRWIWCVVADGKGPVDRRLDEFVDDFAESEELWTAEFPLHYPNTTFTNNIPDYRLLGATWWSEGPSNDHYYGAIHCLQGYVRTGSRVFWDRFCAIALHVAGQGFDHRPSTTGSGLRYEKGRDGWVGSFYPDGFHLWSHAWPETVWLMWYLTGECQHEAWQLLKNTNNNPSAWQGFWGIRGDAWYLRALRCSRMLLQSPNWDRERDKIDDAMRLLETRQVEYFPNDGAHGQLDPWQDWLWLSEAIQCATWSGDPDTTYRRILPVARWHLDNTTREDGWVPYQWFTDGRDPKYTSPVHTSFALPMLTAMVAHGDMDQETFRKHAEVCLSGLPGQHGKRGLRWRAADGKPTDPWGPAACKIGKALLYGLRPDMLRFAGGYKG